MAKVLIGVHLGQNSTPRIITDMTIKQLKL
jgi:hypothetical protein